MKQLLTKLQQLWNIFTAFIPMPLPVGKTQYDTWAHSVLDLSGHFADEESLQWSLAAMVVNSGSKAWRSKNYFVQGLRKSAANQIAGAVMYEMKMKQKAREEAEKQAAAAKAAQPVAPVEATTQSNSGSERPKVS